MMSLYFILKSHPTVGDPSVSLLPFLLVSLPPLFLLLMRGWGGVGFAWGIEFRASCLLGRHSAAELYPQLCSPIFKGENGDSKS